MAAAASATPESTSSMCSRSSVRSSSSPSYLASSAAVCRPMTSRRAAARASACLRCCEGSMNERAHHARQRVTHEGAVSASLALSSCSSSRWHSSRSSVRTAASTGYSSDVISSTLADPGRISHARAMLTAVPTLSPVSIQILMPAVRRSARSSGTPCWSLSSMAVEP